MERCGNCDGKEPSVLLTDEERKKVFIPCETICGQLYPDTDSGFCMDCIADKFCKAQHLKSVKAMFEELDEKLDGTDDCLMMLRDHYDALKKKMLEG
jgi:hypothetical protein